MQTRKKVILLILMTPLLFFVAIFFLQTSSNSNTKMVIIRSNWTEKDFDQYMNKELGVSLPMGFHWWTYKVGFRMQNAKFPIESNTTTWSLIWSFRKNRNQTANLTIIPGMYQAELAKLIERNLMYTQTEVINYFNQSDIWNRWGSRREAWPSWIIPNTYNFSVNANLDDVFLRLKKEHEVFWNQEKIDKLKRQNLTINEAVTIASIVQKESLKTEEYEKIAGVYINRLRINMPLGADPTLVFIRGKGGRVYKKDILLESPYNTYKYKGLPPGPICIPSIEAINAVLNYIEHPYLYFCANSDLSGFHIFEKSYQRHLQNARKFQKVLDRQKKQ